MKKTTTRLATTTAVLVMTAFAILLAQHDARKTSQVEESLSMRRAPSEPPMPLAVENWPSETAVVRGNNDGPLDTTLTAYDNPLRETDETAGLNDLADAAASLFGPSVVTASGESPAPQDKFGAPRSDNGTAPNLPALPSSSLPTSMPSSLPSASPSAFPGNLPDAFPSLSGLPSPSPNLGAPASNMGSTNMGSSSTPASASARLSDSNPSMGTNPSATALGGAPGNANVNANANQAGSRPNNLPGNLPGTTPAGLPPTASRGQPGVARLGVPSAPPPSAAATSPAAGGAPPTPLGNNMGNSAGGSSNWPPAAGTGSLMSDTQRGAMVPTQFPGAAPSINSSAAPTINPGSAPNFNSGSAPSINPASTGLGTAPSTALSTGPGNSNNGLNSSGLNSNGFNSNSFNGNNGAGTTRNANDNLGTPGQAGMAALSNAPMNAPSNSFSQPASVPQGNFGSFGPSSSPRPPESNRMSATSNGANLGSDFENTTMSARTSLVSNQPGSRFLDGSQNPVMQIQKRAPEEITVGKKASFAIIVRNAGNAAAHDVTVLDRIPRGVRFAEASPNVSPTADGLLVWKLGEMGPGDEKTINLQVIPEIEGEVGSVASVHFAAQASVRSMATAPQLELQVDNPSPIVIGQGQEIAVTIRNTGTGVARGIRLEADIPGQLKHESGENQLEAALGDMRPGESKRLMLNVAAIQPGQSVCPLRAVNEDGIQAQNQFNVDVRAPQLQASIAGPARRYLERQATYQVVVSNTGTAIAQNLFFDVHLPVGLKFVSADIAQATYHPETHSVTLGLAELNAGSKASFSISVLPVELGPQGIRFNASGDLGISAEAKGQVVVEGLSELAFTIGQDNGTVEVGATTTYAVQVSNVGNQSDKNVQLLVQLPEGAKLLKVDAPVDYRDEPGRLTFAAVGEMRSRDVKTFRFQVQHNRAGNQVVRAQLTSANWPVAVVKEEGTLVYNDQ